MIPPPTIVLSISTVLTLYHAAYANANNINSLNFCDSSSFSSSSCSYLESSSDSCDPCCAGVNKLTHQAPFSTSTYLAKVSLKFKLPDVFGPEACFSVYNVATSAGVVANLIGSDGIDVCGPVAVVAATSANDYATAPADVAGTYSWTNVLLSETAGSYTTGDPGSAGPLIAAAEEYILSASGLLTLAKTAQATAADPASRTSVQALIAVVEGLILLLNQIIVVASAGLDISYYTTTINQAFLNSVEGTTELLSATTAYVAAAVPYGTYYTVSRSWVLNQPVYAVFDGVVTVANSLYNCFDEYRTIYLSKPLSEIPFADNKSGKYCPKCHKETQSCLTFCNGLKRPSYFPRFETGH